MGQALLANENNLFKKRKWFKFALESLTGNVFIPFLFTFGIYFVVVVVFIIIYFVCCNMSCHVCHFLFSTLVEMLSSCGFTDGKQGEARGVSTGCFMHSMQDEVMPLLLRKRVAATRMCCSFAS